MPNSKNSSDSSTVITLGSTRLSQARGTTGKSSVALPRNSRDNASKSPASQPGTEKSALPCKPKRGETSTPTRDLQTSKLSMSKMMKLEPEYSPAKATWRDKKSGQTITQELLIGQVQPKDYRVYALSGSVTRNWAPTQGRSWKSFAGVLGFLTAMGFSVVACACNEEHTYRCEYHKK